MVLDRGRVAVLGVPPAALAVLLGRGATRWRKRSGAMRAAIFSSVDGVTSETVSSLIAVSAWYRLPSTSRWPET